MAKKTIILDFSINFKVRRSQSPWAYVNGKITAFDDNSVVLEDADGISLLNIDEISSIDWVPKREIIAP